MSAPIIAEKPSAETEPSVPSVDADVSMSTPAKLESAAVTSTPATNSDDENDKLKAVNQSTSPTHYHRKP
jgi:hypothetical protein